MLVLLGVLTGCGSGKTGSERVPEEESGEKSHSGDLSETMKSRDSKDPVDGGTVEAGTVEELLDAIVPGADIIIKPGYYNLSEYLEDSWENDLE